MEGKWNFMTAFSYAGQHFIIWAQPLRQKDGTFIMTTKTEETTLEEIKEHKEKSPIYYAEL